MNKHQDKLTTFFDILFDSKDVDIPEIIKDLKNSDISYDRIEAGLDSLLEKARLKKKRSWLIDAQKTRTEVSEILHKQSQWVQSKYNSARELAQAIHAGTFGTLLQGRANAFFRNQDFKKMSETDLISFIEDCQLLEALSQKNEENK
ncbi:MAG: hypothetical protein HYU97_07090 [Deltaproteobacteria bacterium]|nr:hypothetical protein [Deltaproteobacteria bacterium]